MTLKKVILVACMCVALCVALAACDDLYDTTTYNTRADVNKTMNVASSLAERQPTPSDIQYSLERYNLTRRAYWVNGMREKARTLPCPIADVPMGYVVLLTESGGVVGRFEVDGKVSSLNSYLTPDSEYFEIVYGGNGTYYNKWIADVDGSYGENDNGIFFFTPDDRYIEWSGIYLYSDIPFEVENPVVTYNIGG